MIPLGYLYKRVAQRDKWLSAQNVEDIYSLSSCESEDFADYINFWRHNGYWLFDSPGIIRTIANEHSISLESLRLFYYEAYEEEYSEKYKCWRPFHPEKSFETNIQMPAEKVLEGFDVTCFSMGNTPECSPLSCSSLAETIPTNRHCLFNTFQEAKNAIEQGLFFNSEPGPFRIIAVFSVNGCRVSVKGVQLKGSE